MSNQLNLEKARVMFKLARKSNWNNVYDRTEHFKRFQNLSPIMRELSKIGWIIIHKKPNFVGIALNTQFKSEIIYFIEEQMPELKGSLK